MSLSGATGLVGAFQDDIGSFKNQGSAYVYRNLDTTAAPALTEQVKLTASDGAANDSFGYSVSLSGDQFIIGAIGKNSNTGKAYSGSVSSMTTLDAGNTSKVISGVSFVLEDNWIIGQTTSGNQVTLSAGDTATVASAGKSSQGVYIGRNAGSNNNVLTVAGNVTADLIRVGEEGNLGNALIVSGAGSVAAAGTVTVSPGSRFINNSSTAQNAPKIQLDGTAGTPATLGGNGTYTGGLTLDSRGDTLSPGNSPGTMVFASGQTWNSFTYQWEINNFTGAPNTNYDLITVAGALNLTGGIGAYELDVLSLMANNASGNVPNFSESSQSWDILTTTGGITGFNAANWTVDASGFTNNEAGAFTLAQTGNNLTLNYNSLSVVPEPSRALLLLAGAGLMAGRRRRRLE